MIGRFVAIWRVSNRLIYFWFLVALGGCAARGPLVENLEDAAAGAAKAEIESATGSRDGERTRAEFTLSTAEYGILRLTLAIVYDPQPVLESGAWQDSRGRSGLVVAQSVTFTGGQGQGVSAGGNFRLRGADADLWAVRLPLTALQRPAWKP